MKKKCTCPAPSKAELEQIEKEVKGYIIGVNEIGERFLIECNKEDATKALKELYFK